MRCFLALDLGTKTGWAMGALNPSNHWQIQSGTQSFAPNARFEGGGMRFLKFSGWLNQMQRLCPIERLAFEEVRNHAGVTAAHVYGGFMATLTSWCEANQVPYEGVPVGTIKKFYTGSGNASKDKMIQSARERGHNPKDDNEADALAILYWMTCNHGTPSPVDLRPSPDRLARRRVSVEPIRLPRRPVSR